MKFLIPVLAFAGLIAGPAVVNAQVVALSAVFDGDLCATDVDPAGDLDDCATIAGNAGQRGLHEFLFEGVQTDVAGDMVIAITASDADLFADPGQNNPDERFRLIVDGVDFGLLFDGTEGDEAAANASLAISVQENIQASTGSAAPMALRFTLPQDQSAMMLSDGVLSVQLDFREDRNINRFSDTVVQISYPVAAPPPDLEFLLAEIARLEALIHAQGEAITALEASIDGQ